MLDIKALRTAPDAARAALGRRQDPAALDLLARSLELDEERRLAIAEVELLKAERNATSREVGERKRRGEDAEAIIAAMGEVAARIRACDAHLTEVQDQLYDALLRIPNLPLERVPAGVEGEFETVSEWGEKPEFPFTPRPHWEIGEDLGILDTLRAARVAGSGFSLFMGAGARLSRALIQFMLDLHTRDHGYTEVAPPYLVTRESLIGTGQLPKFEEDVYRTDIDDLFLIPTAEVPVTNLHRGEVLEGDSLPRSYVAYTPCFRREAGAAGRDTRGLLRVHQFDKVELVKFTAPGDSTEELERLTRDAERVLEALELPYRRILLSTGDLGFASALTYDLEVWSAGVGAWLEVSSCSTFADYQARRANIRHRPAPGAGPEFVHTLNGSGVALARTIVALLENNQASDGSVGIPAALRPYFGCDRLTAS